MIRSITTKERGESLRKRSQGEKSVFRGRMGAQGEKSVFRGRIGAPIYKGSRQRISPIN